MIIVYSFLHPINMSGHDATNFIDFDFDGVFDHFLI